MIDKNHLKYLSDSLKALNDRCKSDPDFGKRHFDKCQDLARASDDFEVTLPLGVVSLLLAGYSKADPTNAALAYHTVALFMAKDPSLTEKLMPIAQEVVKRSHEA
jgi:hypothetical protein